MVHGSRGTVPELFFVRPFPADACWQQLEQHAATARVLSDALPFLQAHAGKTIVIKYGGHAMEDAEASLSFARDVVMLKQVFTELLGHGPCVVALRSQILTRL